LLSADSGVEKCTVILWDLLEGRRVATIRPCLGLLTSMAFNADCSQLITVGLDIMNRQQIVVWDTALLVSSKSSVDLSATTPHPSILAKQLSEYHIINITNNPYEKNGLISCGRENIRLWRMRKSHLPGRPVVLNGYCRGYVFNNISLEDSKFNNSTPSNSFIYVSSNKGLILKINATSEQILCAFQLHANSILTFKIHCGYAVTGGEDKRLRIWPLDFSDYLLEARHEGEITCIATSSNGQILAVGTSAGTLGILNVSEHRLGKPDLFFYMC
jgi:WD repeat-containing protein 90